jgi:cobyrinic acid a,c-diamide synthase
VIYSPTPGLIIAAPASGNGKTLFTQALLRLLKNTHYTVAPAKVGPDYIDPHFHTLASGRTCINLDTWAMRAGIMMHLMDQLATDANLILCEGVMGLFDGAGIDDEMSDGSTASLARRTGWPVILVVDAAKQAQSVAALVRGFVTHAPDVKVAGVILNRVGSASHESLLRQSLQKHLPGLCILGALPRKLDLVLPERHLGLVQVQEQESHEAFLETAAAWIEEHIDMAQLVAIAQPAKIQNTEPITSALVPLGSRIAVANDVAFAFSYPSILQGWRDQGAEIISFSPLSGDTLDETCDAIYLPGGYPELHAGTLATNGFLDGLQRAAKRRTPIYGECGGFMVLGQGLTDGKGTRHEMAGLLPVETSFMQPKLHLGYRQMTLVEDTPFGKRGQRFRGHEFHYATTTSEVQGQSLFQVTNASGDQLADIGCKLGSVAGSFMHLIDSADTSL